MSIRLELAMEFEFCSSNSASSCCIDWRLLWLISQMREFSQRLGHHWQKNDSSCWRLWLDEEMMLLQPQLGRCFDLGKPSQEKRWKMEMVHSVFLKIFFAFRDERLDHF